jgi:hypothetical protein
MCSHRFVYLVENGIHSHWMDDFDKNEIRFHWIDEQVRLLTLTSYSLGMMG